jgi:hypothetical protein
MHSIQAKVFLDNKNLLPLVNRISIEKNSLPVKRVNYDGAVLYGLQDFWQSIQKS